MLSCQASCALQLRTTYVDVPRKDCDAGLSQQAAITFDQVSGESSRWHIQVDCVNQRPGMEPDEAVSDHWWRHMACAAEAHRSALSCPTTLSNQPLLARQACG